MPEIKVKTIAKIWNFLEQGHIVNLIYGGAGAGKSYTVAQYLILRILCQERNKHVLVVRKTNPSLKLTSWRMMRSLLEQYSIPYSIHFTDQYIEIPSTGSVLFFRGLDNPERIKSSEFNYIWIEEATELEKEDYLQLKLRLRRKSSKKNRMFLTFNPVPSWIRGYFFEEHREQELGVLKVRYTDNPFLDTQYIEELKALKHQDEAYYQIYALGEFAVPDALIYPKYSVDLEVPSIEQCERVVYGVDFGYNNPTVALRVGFDGKKLYVLDEIYKSHITNAELIEALKSFVKPRNALVVCDSAEPGRIEELRRAGFNAIPAIKNVLDGINKVKEFELHIAKHCENTIKEIKMYSWKKDKKGNTLDEPVKFNDHAMDALRYAVATAMQHTDVAILNKEEWGVW
jgi:phage terminase large subunit